jgi:hypothetical protein
MYNKHADGISCTVTVDLIQWIFCPKLLNRELVYPRDDRGSNILSAIG